MAPRKQTAARLDARCGAQGAARIVASFLEIVPVAHVKRSRAVMMKENLSRSEIVRLAHAPAQTIAGIIALKRALVSLVRATSTSAVTVNEIELSHSRSGAPRLISFAKKRGAAAPAKKDIRLSVSHTKTHAFAIAVHCRRGETNG